MCAVRYGDIVFAEMLDPQGRNPKVRRVVVLTTDRQLDRGVPVVVAAITSTLPSSPGPEFVVLPWHNNRHPKTGLRKRSAVVCSWIAVIDRTSIQDVSGIVPPDHLALVAEKTRDAVARVLGPEWLEPEVGNKPQPPDDC